MGDAVVEQNLKVRPLDGTCVLKLVNHDVTQLSSYLFINERRVLLVNQRVQKFLRVTKRIQAVGFINVLHLFFYPPQKPQFVDVLQGEVNRVYGHCSLLPGLFGLAQQRANLVYNRPAFGSISSIFLYKSLGIFNSCRNIVVGHGGFQSEKVAVPQLLKVSGGTAMTLIKVLVSELIMICNGLESSCIPCHRLDGPASFGT